MNFQPFAGGVHITNMSAHVKPETRIALDSPAIQYAIAKLKHREIEGLEVLVKGYQVKAVRVAYLILGNQPEAEDVVQTAFLQVVEKIDQYDAKRPFEHWFMRIVVNFALQSVRKTRRETSLDEPLFADSTKTLADLLQDDSPLPTESHEQQELRATVRQALKTLNPEQRAAIIMRYYLDMSEEEMVVSTRVPKGTIKWRLHEARQRLRRLLPQWITVREEE
jgi:RNA polymerase sigma-70 factor, ECF subfamily